MDLDPGFWSKPVPSGTAVGWLDRPLAGQLGLPDRVALVAGGHDQTCAALGAGVVRPGRGVASTGTAEVLSTAFDQPCLSRALFDGFYPCYLHAKPGMFFTFGLNHVGGLLLQVVARQLRRGRGRSTPPARGATAYRLMDERMPEEPSPVMVVPHLHGSGTPTCDLDAKGAIVGLTLATTRHDVSKALLEGLCFELRANLDTMQEGGIRVDEIVAVGGGARSDRWLQLKADILGRPIRTLRCREAACLGAALLAGVAAGPGRTLDEAVTAAVAMDREYLPRPARVAQYAERYALYRQLHPALRQLKPKP